MGWTTEVKEDEDGELFIELPEDMLNQLNWGEGTSIKWIDNNNGTFSLVEVKQPVYTIYSKKNCTFCDRAKALLEAYSVSYEEKDVTDPAIREELMSLNPGARSAPQIFEGEELVGGYYELSKRFGGMNATDGEG